jgi:hypothetical protein
MHASRPEPGRPVPDLREAEAAIDTWCPERGEWRLIEYDTAIRRWQCAVCDRQWTETRAIVISEPNQCCIEGSGLGPLLIS